MITRINIAIKTMMANNQEETL